MILLDWALAKWRKPESGAKTPDADGDSLACADRTWRASSSQPSGLAQSQDALRDRMLLLARLPGVERVALLRANGSLFCGRCDAGKEDFAATVQQMAVAARRASRRMGLGAIESLTVEGEGGAIVLAAGHSICAAECERGTSPAGALDLVRELGGVS